MKIKPTILGVGMAFCILVSADTVSYAAAGKSLLLGERNTTRGLTVVERRDVGPALALDTNKSSPPLRVTSAQRVPRLNADMVDGRHAVDLESRALTFVIPSTGSRSPGSVFARIDGLPAGHYLTTWNGTVSAPGGTHLECWMTWEDGTPAGGRLDIRQIGNEREMTHHFNATAVTTFAESTSGGPRSLLMWCRDAREYESIDWDSRGRVSLIPLNAHALTGVAGVSPGS